MNTKNKKRKPGNKRRSSTRNTKNEGITTIYFPIVPYACGLRIAENIGALALESYRKRIAAPIAALDAEDKGFWDWAVAGQIPVTKTTTSGRANHLLHSGVVAAVVGEIPANYFKAQGFG
ncbi:hypothetical protein NIES204_45240 (plasmid) [Planktothrix agardhii NIES-204]|nr:hypothetical protein NIES204_45240 [Planktothrix agardhii NIES-204]